MDGEEYNGERSLILIAVLYKCDITLGEFDILKVRGNMGISLFGRTQYCYRVK